MLRVTPNHWQATFSGTISPGTNALSALLLRPLAGACGTPSASGQADVNGVGGRPRVAAASL